MQRRKYNSLVRLLAGLAASSPKKIFTLHYCNSSRICSYILQTRLSNHKSFSSKYIYNSKNKSLFTRLVNSDTVVCQNGCPLINQESFGTRRTFPSLRQSLPAAHHTSFRQLRLQLHQEYPQQLKHQHYDNRGSQST